MNMNTNSVIPNTVIWSSGHICITKNNLLLQINYYIHKGTFQTKEMLHQEYAIDITFLSSVFD